MRKPVHAICEQHHHHHHHIHLRALFSSTEGWAFWRVFLEGVLSTQNDSEGQQNPYLASFCHSQALHPMISLACQIFSVQPHSACVLLQSSLCCALYVLTISSYWCGSLISTFVVCCLVSIIPPVSISEISSLYLASVAAQASLCLTWLQTPKTGFLMRRLNYWDTVSPGLFMSRLTFLKVDLAWRLYPCKLDF